VRDGPRDGRDGDEPPEAFLAYATSVDVDRELDAGDGVTVDDVQLTVDAVTGHAPGELLFAFEDGDGRVALVGDNVLADITPNPFLQPPAESGGHRPRVLPGYNESLQALREDSFDRFLPGHREPIEDPPAESTPSCANTTNERRRSQLSSTARRRRWR